MSEETRRKAIDEMDHGSSAESAVDAITAHVLAVHDERESTTKPDRVVRVAGSDWAVCRECGAHYLPGSYCMNCEDTKKPASPPAGQTEVSVDYDTNERDVATAHDLANDKATAKSIGLALRQAREEERALHGINSESFRVMLDDRERKAREDERVLGEARCRHAVEHAIDVARRNSADAISAERAKVNAEWSASLGYALDPTNPTDVLCPKTPAECGPMMIAVRKERDEAVRKARVALADRVTDCVSHVFSEPRNREEQEVVEYVRSLLESEMYDDRRLERDQSAASETSEDGSDPIGSAGHDPDTTSRRAEAPKSAAPISAKCEECGCGSGAHLARDTKDRKACSNAFGEAKPPPTTEAPETDLLAELKSEPRITYPVPPSEVYVVAFQDGTLRAWKASQKVANERQYTRADVVEKRVAEAIAEVPEMLAARRKDREITREILGATDHEFCEDAARRVVAERDATERSYKGLQMQFERVARDREAALARVRELEETTDRLRGAVKNQAARAETAERERDKFKAEVAAVDMLRESAVRERDEAKAALERLVAKMLGVVKGED